MASFGSVGVQVVRLFSLAQKKSKEERVRRENEKQKMRMKMTKKRMIKSQ